MKKVLFFVFICFVKLSLSQTVSVYSKEFSGFKLAKDSSNTHFVVNTYGVIVSSIDELEMNLDEIIQKIKNSTLVDRELIVRVLQMHSGYKSKLKEIMNLSQSYPEIAEFVINSAQSRLSEKYSKRQLKKIKKRKTS